MFKTISRPTDYVVIDEDSLISLVAKNAGVSTDKIEIDFDTHYTDWTDAGVIILTVKDQISDEKKTDLEDSLYIFDDDDDVYDYEVTTDDNGLTMVVIKFNDPIYNPNNDF